MNKNSPVETCTINRLIRTDGFASVCPWSSCMLPNMMTTIRESKANVPVIHRSHLKMTYSTYWAIAPNPFRRLCDSASGSVDVCLDGVDDTGGLFLIPDRVDWASRLSALTANVAGDVQRRIHVWKVGSFVRRRTRVVCAAAVVT